MTDSPPSPAASATPPKRRRRWLKIALISVGPGTGNGDFDAEANGHVREAFEGSWVRWNVVRAVTSTAALGCLGLAISRSA